MLVFFELRLRSSELKDNNGLISSLFSTMRFVVDEIADCHHPYRLLGDVFRYPLCGPSVHSADVYVIATASELPNDM